MQHETVVVVAGGPSPGTSAPELPNQAIVIAADGGIDRALALGLHVDVAIGDFDSVSPAGLAAVRAAGTRIDEYPAAKDATDLELALDAAIALRPQRIVVVGSEGGRLDHLLGTLFLLTADRYADARIDAHLGGASAHVVRGSRDLNGAPGELISLLPLHGPAEGVTTHGLVYPLTHETLTAGSTRGISNLFDTREARIEVERGCLLALRPQPTER